MKINIDLKQKLEVDITLKELVDAMKKMPTPESNLCAAAIVPIMVEYIANIPDKVVREMSEYTRDMMAEGLEQQAKKLKNPINIHDLPETEQIKVAVTEPATHNVEGRKVLNSHWQKGFEFTLADWIELKNKKHPENVKDLIYMTYACGIETEPKFRTVECTLSDNQKDEIIREIMKHKNIGALIFNKDKKQDNNMYTIIDGKQRLEAIKEFYTNIIPYKAKYFEELTIEEQTKFMTCPIVAFVHDNLTFEEQKKMYKNNNPRELQNINRYFEEAKRIRDRKRFKNES